MPFLTINGVTIPTKAGGEIKITEYGERTAGFDGSAQIDVRSRKREWQFTTKPISMVRARAIEGLVEGNGFYLPFDSFGGANTSMYAANGMYPSYVQGGTMVYAYAADGYQSFDENGTRGAQVGTSSLSCDPAASNLALAATATCSSTTNWASNNATLAVDTGHYWDGANSIKLTQTTGSTFTYANSPVVAVTTGATYTLSCYIFSASACTFGMGAAYGSATGSPGSYSNLITANHPGGVWKRFTCNAIVSGGNSAVGISINIPAASGSVGPLWIDAIQAEAVTANSSPTAWKAGGTTVPALNLEYPYNYPNPTGFTFSMWYAGNPQGTQAAEVFSFFDSAGNRPFYGEMFPGIQFNVSTNTSNSSGLLQAYLPTNPAGWQHVVATYYGNPFTNYLGTTFPNLNIYVNGVLSTSSIVTGVMNTPVRVDIGSVFGAYNFLGRMDDVQILPFGVDQAWVTGTYNASVGVNAGQYGITGLTPFLTLAGDGIDGGPVTVQGTVKQGNYIGFQDPKYGWISQGRTLQLILTEV